MAETAAFGGETQQRVAAVGLTQTSASSAETACPAGFGCALSATMIATSPQLDRTELEQIAVDDGVAPAASRGRLGAGRAAGPGGAGGAPEGASALRPVKELGGITVLIPAYNEAASIADTLRSVLGQTRPPDEVIVVDDCSKDDTGAIARTFAARGVRVVRPSRNRGCKAAALNFGMPEVRTEFVLAIDADTTLAPDAIEKLAPVLMASEKLGAVSGMVIPRNVRTVWERGRYVEYLYAFYFYKPIQDYYERPVVAPGCFTMYRTAVLREVGGWNGRTVGEDIDLTWTLYARGLGVRVVPEAVCYPIEPPNFTFLRKQLTRWSHGFFQCIAAHWPGVLHMPVLRMMVAVGLWDAVLAATVFFAALPLLAFFVHPLFILGYFADLPVILPPVLYAAAKRGEVGKALASIPAFYVIRLVNFYFCFKAFLMEWVLRRPLRTFEKGH